MIREMERIRARGYAIDDEEHEPGVRCIAAAIRNRAGAPVAAVSISAPVTRMDQATMDRLLPKLLATVEEISRMLGYAPRLTIRRKNNAARISVRHCFFESGIRPPGNR